MKLAAKRRFKKQFHLRFKISTVEMEKRFTNFVYLSAITKKLELRTAYFFFRKTHNGDSVSKCKKFCFFTGRGHSIYGSFKYTRNAIRSFFHQGFLYGIVKSSW